MPAFQMVIVQAVRRSQLVAACVAAGRKFFGLAGPLQNRRKGTVDRCRGRPAEMGKGRQWKGTPLGAPGQCEHGLLWLSSGNQRELCIPFNNGKLRSSTVKVLSYLKALSLKSSLSSTLMTASIFALVTAAPHVQAQVSVDNMPNLDRGFGFSYNEPDATNNAAYEFYMKGDPSLERFKQYLRRDSINFILGVVTGDRPDFIRLVESSGTKGSREIIKKQWGIQGKTPSNRSINQSFNQRLIRGQPQMIDAYGLGGGKALVGPVYKRAIFLKRDGEASQQTVDSELSAYAERIAKEVDGISDRVMLYTMNGLPWNWPTASYPELKDVKRQYDAVIMIWPKKDRIIPSNFYGVPENYRVLHALNLAGYYYAAPAPAK